MDEATIKGGVPTTAGRFVINARDARWMYNDMRVVHCPPGTAHTIIAAGAEPALILAVGARKDRGSTRYPVEPAAARHGAGVPDEETTARDHYATFGAPQPGPPPALFAQRSSR